MARALKRSGARGIATDSPFASLSFRGTPTMTIKPGDKLPEASLMEFIHTEQPGCALGPNKFEVAQLAKGKRIVVFGLPGAFTPTCSAQHVPSFVSGYGALKAAGVDEIWCVAVNDAFVMGAWGETQHTAGKVRMMADGSALFTRALGLELDLTARGMGVRSQRYSMLVEDGVVKLVNVEQGPKFEVSGAEPMLAALSKR
jgi:peroxiredoxin